jgi:hypothetical protein
MEKKKKSKNDDTIITHNKGNVEKGMSQPVIIVDQDAGIDMSENEGNEMMGCHLKITNQEKNNKGTKLGAKVTGSFKGRITSKNPGRATLETIVENIEKNKLTNIFKEQFQQVREDGNNNETTDEIRGFNFQEMGLHVGLPLHGAPNVPRPPDLQIVPPFINISPAAPVTDNFNLEKENFLDASDQVGEDSDMEVVKETPLGDA